MEGFLNTLIQFVAGFESWQQIGALALVGAIPFVESYLGSMLGTIVGISPWVAVPAAVAGNIACTFLLIYLASKGRSAITRNRAEFSEDVSPRRQKVAKYLERFGVPGVALLGPIVLASQLTAPIVIALGAKKEAVYLWFGISIVLWGILFGFFGNYVAGLMA